MDRPIETQVALLQHDIEANKDMVSRLATTTDRIGEVAAYVAKILAVHDERLTKAEETQESQVMQMEQRRLETQGQFKEVYERIEKLEGSITKDLEGLENAIMTELAKMAEAHTQKVDVVDKRIRTLENWRWMLVGGGIVLGFVIGKIPGVNELVKFLAS